MPYRTGSNSNSCSDYIYKHVPPVTHYVIDMSLYAIATFISPSTEYISCCGIRVVEGVTQFQLLFPTLPFPPLLLLVILFDFYGLPDIQLAGVYPPLPFPSLLSYCSSSSSTSTVSPIFSSQVWACWITSFISPFIPVMVEGQQVAGSMASHH